MPCSHPAIAGDFGISGERPAAPSRTISPVAATITSATSEASAARHPPERMRATPRSPCAATLTKPGSSQRRPDRLRLEVGVETVVAVLAADARGLEAAEGRRRVDEPPGVHVHRARTQHRGEAVGAGDVARPDTGCEAVLAVVGAPGD